MSDTTAQLLARARDGDGQARSELLARYAVILKRLATARTPAGTMSVPALNDLVQEVLRQAFEQLDAFEPRREGAFLAHLRHLVLDRIPAPPETHRPAPLEAAIGSELLEDYDTALDRLAPEQREGIILRLEMGLAYQEIADALDASTMDEARTNVGNAIFKLSELLDAR